MINNYRYFIALVEEGSITAAAEKLYISHQCLSRYLQNLEKYYHISLFDRKPVFTPTEAGREYYELARKVLLLEENFESTAQKQLSRKMGRIRFGVTEGRHRTLMPDLIIEFKKKFPSVELEIQCSANSNELVELVSNNSLDVAFVNLIKQRPELSYFPALTEKMFVVMSDDLLRKYFPDTYPKCITAFSKGVDLADFQHVPFVIGVKGFNSHTAIDRYLLARNINLHYSIEMSQLDLHLTFAKQDYAACFCWSMYLPMIRQLNEQNADNPLYAFPIEGPAITNQVAVIKRKDKILPDYGDELIRLLISQTKKKASVLK